ncbi:hypothetical protein GCM10023148_10430 [Actinokineospora soli]
MVAGCAAPTTGVPTAAPGATTTTPPTTTPPPTTTTEPDGFTIVAGGDVLIHPALTEQAEADGGATRDYAPSSQASPPSSKARTSPSATSKYP